MNDYDQCHREIQSVTFLDVGLHPILFTNEYFIYFSFLCFVRVFPVASRLRMRCAYQFDINAFSFEMMSYEMKDAFTSRNQAWIWWLESLGRYIGHCPFKGKTFSANKRNRAQIFSLKCWKTSGFPEEYLSFCCEILFEIVMCSLFIPVRKTVFHHEICFNSFQHEIWVSIEYGYFNIYSKNKTILQNTQPFYRELLHISFWNVSHSLQSIQFDGKQSFRMNKIRCSFNTFMHLWSKHLVLIHLSFVSFCYFLFPFFKMKK